MGPWAVYPPVGEAMADDRLRQLERRFRESGAVEDEAAWLRARVRAGELPEERLRLAARMGQAAAAAALGVPCGELGWRWAASSPEADLRVRCAAAALWVRARPTELMREASAVLDRLVVQPRKHPGKTVAVRRLRARLGDRLGALAPEESDVREALELVGLLAVGGAAIDDTLARTCENLRAAGARAPEQAVRDELIAWARGRGDPVRMRVEARRATPRERR